MIKICHIVDDLKIGGLETTVKNIVLNLDKKEYQQEIWCLLGKGVLAEEIEESNIVVRLFNCKGELRISSLVQLVKELRKKDFDIIHSHGFFPSIWARIASIFTNIPVNIVHCQNLYYDIIRKDRVKERFLSLFTSKFVAVSEAVKKSLVEFIGIRPKKIRVIYNSCGSMKVKDSQQRQRTRESLGIKSEDFVVGNISRLESHKGHRYLIDAVSELKYLVPDIKCLIAGDGSEMENLKLKAIKSKLENTVIFTGWRRDIENLLSAMDVFIQPSILTEGMSLCLVEAASAGLPLVVTNIGGMPEFVNNGVNGFIVPEKNSKAIVEKIKYLYDNSPERDKMGRNAAETWFKTFSLKKMIEEMDKLYRDEINNYYHPKF